MNYPRKKEKRGTQRTNTQTDRLTDRWTDRLGVGGWGGEVGAMTTEALTLHYGVILPGPENVYSTSHLL